MTFKDIRLALNSSVLMLYRIFAIITLYAVLAGVLGFALVIGVYAMSRTWVAPIILSEQDKDTLDLTGKLLTSQTTAQDLQLDIGKQEKIVAEARTHKAALQKLHPAIDAAIARENQHRAATGPPLVELNQQKKTDIVTTQAMLKELAKVEAMVDKDLALGLITKSDAIQAKTQFAKAYGDLTDSQIASVLLKDNILEKTGSSTALMETLEKKAELESEITNLDITISTALAQIATENGQITQFNKAVDLAKQTPMGVAMQGSNINLALVPYENQKVATEGTAVYDCYLSFLACRQVGRLKTIFVGEQHAIHPIFHTDIRGFLVQLELSNPESAKSKTLFLGSKPLFF
jgi:hypothetical protein